MVGVGAAVPRGLNDGSLVEAELAESRDFESVKIKSWKQTRDTSKTVDEV